MTEPSLSAQDIIDLPRFRSILQSVAVRSVVTDVADIEDSPALEALDWSFALMCASALTPIADEAAQEAVLRIVQGCLRDPDSSEDQRGAALMLLDRVGNRRAGGLAIERGLAEQLDYARVPIPLSLDAAARHQSLTIEIGDDQTLEVNEFQRAFWQLADDAAWLSVSAPTSAGKSHIVREWIVRELRRGDGPLQVVYIAPTRALVDEVSGVFREHPSLPVGAGIHTVPWDTAIPNHERQIFVLTQERLHSLQHRMPNFAPHIVFVDEAQKIGDGTRGILLSQVIDESLRRRLNLKLILASPLTANPDVVFGGASPAEGEQRALVGTTVTVNQNLIYIGQVPRQPTLYGLSLYYGGEVLPIGGLRLPQAPDGVAQRIAFVAATFGKGVQGNLVYADGPAKAEEYANLIYTVLGPESEISGDTDIDGLVDLVGGVVHDRYDLARVARRGVAYHYGDMPLVLKARVEELFKSGKIRFLVCTSTLLEGVNLPCRNLFVRSPHKGRARMDMSDFWNLAGRAGRWGQEFEGNIICIDGQNEKTWPERPEERTRSTIAPAAQTVVAEPSRIVSYANDGAPMPTSEVPAEVESTYSWLALRYLTDNAAPAFGISVPDEVNEQFREALRASLDELTLSQEVILRHAGISPLSMQRLYDAILADGHPENLTLVPPTADDAHNEYRHALRWVSEYLGGSFGNERRRSSLANLIVQWMRGMPLRILIDNRANYLRSRNEEVRYPALIRQIMSDVEDIARYEAPKYLSCYADVVAAAASAIEVQIDQSADGIAMMLELGVPRQTDMSFIAVGLSRASTRELSNLVLEDDWTPEQCALYLQSEIDLEAVDIPRYAIREIGHLRSVLLARNPSN